jgi:hypothetical protein
MRVAGWGEEREVGVDVDVDDPSSIEEREDSDVTADGKIED